MSFIVNGFNRFSYHLQELNAVELQKVERKNRISNKKYQQNQH